MGKYGKKVNVSLNLSDYMIGVMGPSGFGKSTLMYDSCEKEFGPDGYIILDMSMEDGTAALQGATAERVVTWKKMIDVVTDIVENKESDYPDLKVVIWDTLDAAFEAAESYCVKAWNSANMGKQGFVKATSINSVEGGFGRGMDKTIEIVRREIARLKDVGVQVWWTAHVKEKDQVDLFTGASYTSLTANMPIKYFNSIKNSSHIIAFGYFDRSIERQEIGEANPVTKKKKERKAVTDEARKLKFRDDAMVADAKSRFSHIVDEINLDADEFIKAIKDAIVAERGGRATLKAAETKVDVPPILEEPEAETVVEEILTSNDADGIDYADAYENANLEDVVQTMTREERIEKIKTAVAKDPSVKKQVATILAENGMKMKDVTDEVLSQIEALLDF